MSIPDIDWSDAISKAEPAVERGLTVLPSVLRSEVLDSAVREAVSNLFGVKLKGPLEKCHLELRSELVTGRDPEGLRGSSVYRLSRAGSQLRMAYRSLIEALRSSMGIALLVEEDLYIRFHFPVRSPDDFRLETGELMCHHSDLMLGTHPESINMWWALTACAGSNALQTISFQKSLAILDHFQEQLEVDELALETSRKTFFRKLLMDLDFRALVESGSSPLPMQQGELCIFDPRVIHATAENVGNDTRISIDFRSIPADSVGKITQRQAVFTHPTYREGRIPVSVSPERTGCLVAHLPPAA